MNETAKSRQNPLTAPVRSEPEQTTQPYGDRAHVLSKTASENALEATPTAICCPNCGEAVTINERGLPNTVPQFEKTCTRCAVELRTWCAVAVDAAYLEIVEPSTLTEMVQTVWDETLWAGVTNSKGEPRNEEYTAKRKQKAASFGWDWEPSCPLCRRSLTELRQASAVAGGDLDYHHWSTEPDQGVCLCRECHDIIGFDTYDTKLEAKAESWGFESRHDLQVIRLALRDAVATEQRAGPWMASMLVDRYNLTQSVDRVQSLLRTIQHDDELRDRFVDDRLRTGLKDD